MCEITSLSINGVRVEPLVEFTLNAVIQQEYSKLPKPKPGLVEWLEKQKMIRILPVTKPEKRAKRKEAFIVSGEDSEDK